jgi:selenide,water dikinase
MGPGDLEKALSGLPRLTDPNLIRGLDSPDDAGVYKINNRLAIIQTLDFFTPIVDDPYAFGKIAAANSLSDVYAMGGKPLTAMNIACFPTGLLDISVLNKILKGGAEKVAEAGALLVGGHTVDDKELKYGLSVTGVVNPNKMITNSGARPGDKLILTKPLGTGILGTAVKAGLAQKKTIKILIECMATLNNKASEIMQQVGVNGCTDITGFGFIGHAAGMAENSRAGITIFADSIPLLPETEDFALKGALPGGTQRNREFYAHLVKFSNTVPQHKQDILFDAQTSGGLLISVSGEKAEKLINSLHQAGVKDAVIAGEVVERPQGKLIIK